MSRNLPPGTTPADIDRHYSGGIPDHDHEWELVEGMSPFLEDMAAIFHEQCRFVEVVTSYTDQQRDEVYYEYGQECEAERHYRFELAYVTELTEEDRPNLKLDRDELDRLEEEEHDLFETALDTVIEAEQAFPDETEIIEIDPDKYTGRVVIRHDGYEFGYEPNGGDDS